MLDARLRKRGLERPFRSLTRTLNSDELKRARSILKKMAEEILFNENIPIDKPEPLPFPFNQRTFCRYEPIEKRIEEARVLVVDDLLRDEGDVSELAVKEWGRY